MAGSAGSPSGVGAGTDSASLGPALIAESVISRLSERPQQKKKKSERANEMVQWIKVFAAL